jgi:hypothetical protein
VKKLALAAAGVLAVTSLVGLTGSATASAACGSRAPSDLDHSAYQTATGQYAVYNGSHTTCLARGDFRKGDKLDYYCFTINPQSEQSWTYLSDASNRAVEGWVNDNNLPNNGSGIYCGF